MIKKDHYYYVYIITDESRTRLETGLAGVLSIGIRQLETKFADSPQGVCKYLVFWEKYDDALAALVREKKLKKLSRKKKIDMINKTNPEWLFLNEEIHKKIE